LCCFQRKEFTNLSSYPPLLQSIKPTVLIGTSGVGRTFTKEVVEAMASFNEVIFFSVF
jgi:malate dehydrogenase (oxaloacetate-decarboxylating)(NADP+)